jgi:hypothetical protein
MSESDSMRPVGGNKGLVGADCCPEKDRQWPSSQVWTGDDAPNASYVL